MKNTLHTETTPAIIAAATTLSHALHNFSRNEYGTAARTALVGGDTLHVACLTTGHVTVTLVAPTGNVLWETACFDANDATDPVYVHLIHIIKTRMDLN